MTDNLHTASAAVNDILAERQRQIEAEGWTPEHDDQHTSGAMAAAAACYALAEVTRFSQAPRVSVISSLWPWSWDWWKPADHRRNLVKAAALIIAEIERLDRAKAEVSHD